MAGPEKELTGNESLGEAEAQLEAIFSSYEAIHAQTALEDLAHHIDENRLLAQLLVARNAFPQMAMLEKGKENHQEIKPVHKPLLDIGEFPDGPQLTQHVLLEPSGALYTSPVIEGVMSNFVDHLGSATLETYKQARGQIIPAITRAMGEAAAKRKPPSK